MRGCHFARRRVPGGALRLESAGLPGLSGRGNRVGNGNDIEHAVGIASQENNNIDIIVKKVCQILNKPLLEKHPLFTKTIRAHIENDL